MSTDAAHRFEDEFAPRIADTLANLFGPDVQITIAPREGRGHPTRVRICAHATHEHWHHPYRYPLDISLTWDIDEIERLMEPDGAARFEHYLESVPRKLASWETARDIDFDSRTQGEPEVLLGGLDFEG